MSDESRRVLDMLSQGKITVADAEQLLQALNETPKAAAADEAKTSAEGEKAKPKYFCVVVEPSPGASNRHQRPVSIRLPLGILRAGIKLAAVMPESMQVRVNQHLKERGIDLDVARMKPESLEALLSSLGELKLDVDSDEEKVRIFCE